MPHQSALDFDLELCAVAVSHSGTTCSCGGPCIYAWQICAFHARFPSLLSCHRTRESLYSHCQQDVGDMQSKGLDYAYYLGAFQKGNRRRQRA